MAGYGYKELDTYYLDDPNKYPSGVNMEMDEVIKVTLYCNFHFQSFPFDNQKCDLSLYDAIYDKGTTQVKCWLLNSDIFLYEFLTFSWKCHIGINAFKM